MSKESIPSQLMSFHKSVRMLHGFLREKQNSEVIDIKEINNFTQIEGLTFGLCQENGNQRDPQLHLGVLEGLGAIEIIEEDETSIIRLVDKEKIP